MSHALFKLRGKVFNTPQLMQPAGFETVVDYINGRCDGSIKAGTEQLNQGGERYSYNADMQVAIMNIDGPLTYKPITMFGMDCGGANYQTIKEDFTFLVESGAKTIALNVDSGGGEAFQLFPTARYMRQLADENGVRILTYVDGSAFSAMYGLAAISDEIILAPDAQVGSIGVVVRLMNDSKAIELKGFQRTYIKAGASKVPFDENGEFRAEFLEDIQDKVDVMYEEFVDHVALMRDMTSETVRSTEAKTYLPRQALELGLADSVKTLEEFYSYLADVAQAKLGSDNNMLKNKLFARSQEDSIDMTLQEQLEKVQTELSEAQASVVELADMKEQFASMKATLETKQTELSAALETVQSLTQEKLEAKETLRKTQLKEVLAEDKVEAVAASLSALDDEAFKTVLEGFAVQKQAIEASDLMQELGAETDLEADAEKPKASTTDDIIKQKLNRK